MVGLVIGVVGVRMGLVTEGLGVGIRKTF